MKQRKMKARVVIDIEFDMDEMSHLSAAEIAELFKETASQNLFQAIGNGILTGDTELVLDSHDTLVRVDDPVLVDEMDREDELKAYSVCLRPVLAVRLETFSAASAKDAIEKARGLVNLEMLDKVSIPDEMGPIRWVEYTGEIDGIAVNLQDEEDEHIDNDSYPVLAMSDHARPF